MMERTNSTVSRFWTQALLRTPISRFLGHFRGVVHGERVQNGRLLVERALPLGILAVAVACVPILIFSPSGLERLENLRRERVQADAEIGHLNQEIRQLRAAVGRVKQDPAAVERVARDELGLVRQTELVFQFKD
jgi:cell division protein FtsB